MPERIISKAIEALPGNAANAQIAFTRRFYSDARYQDLAMIGTDAMADLARRHWERTRKRKLGDIEIAFETVTTHLEQGPVHQTAINIICDDMSFLVDSIAAELAALGYYIELFLHPAFRISTDRKGRIRAIDDDSDDQALIQSNMHIRLTSTVPEEQQARIEGYLRQVLAEVDKATSDWLLMREQIRSAQRGLSNAPDSYNEVDIEEYLELLEFMYQGNFTLLGVRHYSARRDDEGRISYERVANGALGLLDLNYDTPYLGADDDRLPEDLPDLLGQDNIPPLLVFKMMRHSSVHRHVPIDALVVQHFDKQGKCSGQTLLIGLFTSVVYNRSIASIPYLRLKADRIMQRAGYAEQSHNRKALAHILEKYPRDELFQIDVDYLYDIAIGILRLQERQRTALYTRSDMFGRFISCLIYVPKDRFDTSLRLRFQELLETELDGTCTDFYSSIDDAALARLIYVIETGRGAAHDFSHKALEDKIVEAGRAWSERMAEVLHAKYKDVNYSAKLAHKYAGAFPVGYRERYSPKAACMDITKIESVHESGCLELDVYRTGKMADNQLRLKVYHPDRPMTLSDILPVLENMGLCIVSELPFDIRPGNNEKYVWVHDFLMEYRFDAAKLRGKGDVIDLETVKPVFEGAVYKIWYGSMEDDGLNTLVLATAMPWREVTVLRAYLRYLRQTGYPFSLSYMQQALTQNHAIAGLLIRLFHARFDPDQVDGDMSVAAGRKVEIEHAMENVTSLDHDRILRSMVELIQATLRTNYYTGQDWEHLRYLSFKLDSRQIRALEEPRPYREIFVYSPRFEAVHLRGDLIARGGIRWSDRAEDFRTEVKELMKAQMVKNALIVPMGAKGGFVIKRPPKSGDRQALRDEGIACYKDFVRGMLDITDNRDRHKVIPPGQVVRHDDDDPYLVVAPDKGTADFSDIANEIAINEYSFWLDDAFASAGSSGYDHKKMGITARGAWESVKRHFRELNHDTQSQPFDVIGCGDMGGDVFGNGMLLSGYIRLIGAFNHLHIFIDPDPDTAASFAERQRLFDAGLGWDHYDESKLSNGGRIFDRSAKNLELTPEIQRRLNIKQSRVTPIELIRAMLGARCDLLWFGGIGTYIKAGHETHADVGDKANDHVRINGDQVQAHVIAEGANLAATQAGRIEYARHGGRVNADFIDNSGGVDSSDHEVNIKILLKQVMDDPAIGLSRPERDQLLEDMEEEVAGLVLRNNYQQAQAISLMELQAADHLHMQDRFISDLERDGLLSRERDDLPGPEDVQARLRAGKGLHRPELALLQSYAKIKFTKDLMNSDIPDSREMYGRLMKYFPQQLRDSYESHIQNHRLRREIIATTLAMGLVNRMGPTFVKARMDKTGASCAEVARAYLIVRESFQLRYLWNRLEALDGQVPAQAQLRAMRDIARLVERGVTWFLTRLGRKLNIDKDIAAFKDGIAAVHDCLDDVITPELEEVRHQWQSAWESDGLPADLAADIARIPLLGAAYDIIRIARNEDTAIPATARVYFGIGAHFQLDWLRQQARFLTAEDRWSAEARDGLVEQLYRAQAGLATRVLTDMRDRQAQTAEDGRKIVAQWLDDNAGHAAQLDPVFADMRRAGSLDMHMLVTAEQRLRSLYGG